MNVEVGGDNRLVDEVVGVQDVDRVLRQDSADRVDVEPVVVVQLLIRQGAEGLDVAGALLVRQVDRRHVAVRQPVDREPLDRTRFAAQDMDLVAEPRQGEGEIAAVLVRAGTRQRVAVIKGDPHALLNRPARPL